MKVKKSKIWDDSFKLRQIPFIWHITLYNWAIFSTIFSSFKKITRPRRECFTLYRSRWSVKHSTTFWNNLTDCKTGLTGEITQQLYAEVYKSGFLQLSETTKELYAEVDESDFVVSGSLPSTGNIYIRLKPDSKVRLSSLLLIYNFPEVTIDRPD